MNINSIGSTGLSNDDDHFTILPYPYPYPDPIYPIKTTPKDPQSEEAQVENKENKRSSCDRSSRPCHKRKQTTARPRVGLLPPDVQRKKEERTILADQRLFDLLDGETVASIEKTEAGYVVFTNQSFIKVDVTYLPREEGKVGPAKFELSFHAKKPYLG